MSNENKSVRISCCSLPMLIGMTGAVCVSWCFNHSVAWAILHGFLGWFYLAYKAIWYVVTNF